MNIALINPKTDVEQMRILYDRHENLALGLLSAYLKEKTNFKIFIYDLRVDSLNIEELIETLKNNNINIVTISVNYVTLPQSIEIAQELKINIENIKVIFGGEHVTYLDKKILEQYGKYIDFIVRGEAEITTLELLNNISNKSYHHIKSISYRVGGGEVKKILYKLQIERQ